MAICSATRSKPVTASVTGMLHLNARVHFQEVESVTLQIDEKFDRTRAAIGEPLGKLNRGRMDARAEIRGKSRSGRLLDQFLIAALDRQSRSPR